MRSNYIHKSIFVFVILLLCSNPIMVYSQISPGDLAEPHSHLEGMSHCTDCHTLGQKVSNEKCLDCHSLLNDRIKNKLGYHSSNEISGKECISCHSDHHGKKFEMIRFDRNEFNHNHTGYDLLGAHTKLDCNKCHKKEFIDNGEIRKKEYTYLGLSTDCISCHDDYHQKTLSNDCSSCHNLKAFKPASLFNHDLTKFKLLGKHQDVVCAECHKVSTINGSKYQEFSNIAHESCTDCHKDIHNNKFGQNCTKCHTVQSFNIIKGLAGFDHNSTRFKLEDKHQFVDCKKCHKTKFTDPVRHDRCLDCHEDYHRNQFVAEGNVVDCADCHSTKGFAGSYYTIERHQESQFPLVGAHIATPCFVCHKKENNWNFKEIGIKCIDCHDDIHDDFISEKYYPNSSCKKCHNEQRWSSIAFDHKKTGYELVGKHKDQSCRECHFNAIGQSEYKQRFNTLKNECVACHKDKHNKQFEENGITDCYRCHDFYNWNAEKFDHNTTRFSLDGKHATLTCSKCHKNKLSNNKTFVLYKLNTIKCEDCH